MDTKPRPHVERQRTDVEAAAEAERRYLRRRTDDEGWCKAHAVPLMFLIGVAIIYMLLPLIMAEGRQDAISKSDNARGAYAMKQRHEGFRDILFEMSAGWRVMLGDSTGFGYSLFTIVVMSIHFLGLIYWIGRHMNGFYCLTWFVTVLCVVSAVANYIWWLPSADDVIQMEGPDWGAVLGVAQPQAHQAMSERISFLVVMTYDVFMWIKERHIRGQYSNCGKALALLLWGMLVACVGFYVIATRQLRTGALLLSACAAPLAYTLASAIDHRSLGVFRTGKRFAFSLDNGHGHHGGVTHRAFSVEEMEAMDLDDGPGDEVVEATADS